MNDKIRSSRLSLEDAGCLFDLAQRAGQFGWSIGQWRDEISHPTSHIWGVKDPTETSLIAFLAFRHDSVEFWIMNLAVDTAYRRTGVATHLMDGLVQKALLAHADIWLEVRSANKAAIDLYKQFGFDVASIRKGYYAARNNRPKEDAILMSRSVDMDSR